MKKVLFTLLAASLLVACNKNKDVDVVFPEPATKAAAVSIDFDKAEPMHLELLDRLKPSDPATTQPGKQVDLTIHDIDLTEDSRYVLYMEDKATKVAIDNKIKLVWTGKYKKEGDTYKLDGIGEITLVGVDKVGFRPANEVAVKGGDTYEYTANITPINNALGTIGANLARNWKVESTYVKVQGGKNNVSVSQNFNNGCDLHEIARTLKEKNVSLSDADVAQLAGYKITELNFIGNGNMLMNFDGPESYYGTWTVSGNNISWELNDSNRLIAAKATGTVTFPSNGKAILVINADVSTGDEKYTGTIQLTIVQVN